MSEPYLIVVRPGDVFMRHLGGVPMLIDLCNDGKSHEAWPQTFPDSPGYVQWRARDDKYDAANKPADVEYRMVRVGRNPDYNKECTHDD